MEFDLYATSHHFHLLIPLLEKLGLGDDLSGYRCSMHWRIAPHSAGNALHLTQHLPRSLLVM